MLRTDHRRVFRIPGLMAFVASGVLAPIASAGSSEVFRLLLDVDAESAPQLEPLEPAFGTMDTVDWWVGGMAAAELGITHLASGRGGVDWFVARDFSIGIQGELGWAGTDGDAGGWSFGLAPILRWHFLNRGDWSLFAEAGVGAAWTTVPIPAGGTRFNFTPQAGLGATWRLDDDWRLRATLGWFHMSNARTSGSNPGLDAIAISIGIGRTF